MPLDPHLAKYLEWIFRTNTACRAGGYENLRLLAQESRENPRGESKLSPKGFFPGFPRMQSIRAGVQRTPGKKRSSINLNYFAKAIY